MPCSSPRYTAGETFLWATGGLEDLLQAASLLRTPYSGGSTHVAPKADSGTDQRADMAKQFNRGSASLTGAHPSLFDSDTSFGTCYSGSSSCGAEEVKRETAGRGGLLNLAAAAMIANPQGRKRSTCSVRGCPKRPSFAMTGERPARCKTHKVAGDANMKHRRCIQVCPTSGERCASRSRFGKRGSKSVHCKDHRQPGEIDPFRPPCTYPGCNITPTYSQEGRKPERCATHKRANDINTNRQKCGVRDCTERPCFENSVTGVKHCLKHFTDGDTGGLRGMCQARDPGSLVPCKKYATFSEIKGRALRCKEHKLANDVDVLNKKCATEGCSKRPSFAAVGEAAKRCKSHALSVDVNVIGKRCSLQGCETIVGVKRTMCKLHAP